MPATEEKENKQNTHPIKQMMENLMKIRMKVKKKSLVNSVDYLKERSFMGSLCTKLPSAQEKFKKNTNH